METPDTSGGQPETAVGGLSREDRDIHGRIAIVGGGIGGLATALALRRAGIGAEIFEMAPELREVGAGIQIGPNTVRLLQRFGLGERLREMAVRPEVVWEYRRWEDGRVLFQQTFGDEDEVIFGAPYYVVHRADLLNLLAEAVSDEVMHLSRRVTRPPAPPACLDHPHTSPSHTSARKGRSTSHGAVKINPGRHHRPHPGRSSHRQHWDAGAPHLRRRLLAVHGFQSLSDPGGHVVTTEELGVSFAPITGWLSMLGEAGLGVLLVVGLLSRLAGALAGVLMGVTWLVSAAPQGLFTGAPGVTNENALLLMAGGLALAFLGGGRFALDRVIPVSLPRAWRGPRS